MQLARRIFEENLQYFRQAKGYSQSELSKKCGYDRTYFNKIENGHRIPTLPVLCNLAFVLELGVQDFFQLNNPMCYQMLAQEVSENTRGSSDYLETHVYKHLKAFDWNLDAFLLLESPSEINRSVHLQPNKTRTLFDREIFRSDGKKFWKLPFWRSVEPGKNKIMHTANYMAGLTEPHSIEMELLPKENLNARVKIKFISIYINKASNLFVEFVFE